MRDAKDAVYDFHGRSFLGERLIVEIARGTRQLDEKRPRGNDRSRSHYNYLLKTLLLEQTGSRLAKHHFLLWGCLNHDYSDLKDMMRKAGEVTFADISRNRPTEGIVEFHVRDDMEYALKKLNGRELNGQRIELREDPTKDVGSSRRSNSRSRSRSPRRRSRSSRRRHNRSPSRSVSRSRKRRISRRDETPERDDSYERRRAKPEPKSRSRSPASGDETIKAD
ncbi:unnamed protein product [Rhizopus stolonifer]